MNGIGGRTIAEAQDNMTIREYQLWLLYRQKYGGLNPMMRTEWGCSLIATVIANANRSKNTKPFTISDFSPHLFKEHPSEGISLEEAMKTWG